MTRGEAQRFADGYGPDDLMAEVEHALDKAASAEYVDMKFREANEALENHLMHYGYDRLDLMGADQ